MAAGWDERLASCAAALSRAASEEDVRRIVATSLSEAFPEAPRATSHLPLPPPHRALALERTFPIDSPGAKAVSHLAASALDRLAATTELAQLRDRFNRLRAAGRAVASSLDYGTTLQSLPRVFVPTLADWCTLKIVDPEGPTHALVAHADPSRTDTLREFALGPTGRLSDEVLAALGRGEVVYRSRTRDVLANPVEGDFVELLGACAILGLSARGRVVGALAFGRRSPSAFDPEHLAMAEDIAHRAALAVDNARLYREALQATRVRDEFISIASHELRTPLTALNLDVQLAARAAHKLPDPGVFTRRLDDGVKQVNRLTRLVGDLLDVSRISAGRLDIEREVFDLLALARAVADRFEAEATLLGTTILVDGTVPTPANLDALRIDQVLTNLVSNALKYGNRSPVRVRVAADDHHVRVEVADAGIGIPTEAQGRIFDRFTRAAPKGHAGGLGLGLWIVREIVVAHRGTIRVESQPGAGTVFRVELPRWA